MLLPFPVSRSDLGQELVREPRLLLGLEGRNVVIVERHAGGGGDAVERVAAQLRIARRSLVVALRQLADIGVTDHDADRVFLNLRD